MQGTDAMGQEVFGQCTNHRFPGQDPRLQRLQRGSPALPHRSLRRRWRRNGTLPTDAISKHGSIGIGIIQCRLPPFHVLVWSRVV